MKWEWLILITDDDQVTYHILKEEHIYNILIFKIIYLIDIEWLVISTSFGPSSTIRDSQAASIAKVAVGMALPTTTKTAAAAAPARRPSGPRRARANDARAAACHARPCIMSMQNSDNLIKRGLNPQLCRILVMCKVWQLDIPLLHGFLKYI